MEYEVIYGLLNGVISNYLGFTVTILFEVEYVKNGAF